MNDLETTIKQYLFGFLVCLMILIPSLIGVHQYLGEGKYIDLSVIGTVVFFVMSLLLFFFLNISLKSTNKQLFLSITLANMLVKMVTTIAILLIYRKFSAPPDNKFVFPFLIIYISFTIFETWFMVKLAHRKP